MDSALASLIRDAGLAAIETIKQTAPVVWEMAYRREYITTIIGLWVFGILSLVSLGFVGLFVWATRNDDDFFMGVVISLIVFIALIVGIIVGIVDLYTLDYATMERLLRLVTSGGN